MFSGKILNFLLFSVLFVMTIQLSGCNVIGCYESDEIVISEDSKIFIVYGCKASDYVIKNAQNLGNTLKEQTGASVVIKSDWKFNEKNDLRPDDRTAVVILYGDTDQELSKSCYESIREDGFEGYMVKTTGNHIVISATTEKLLMSAAEDIIADYSKEDRTFEIPCDKSIKSTENNFFCIADKGQVKADFVIKEGVGEDARALTRLAAQMIGKKCNKSADVYFEGEYIESENNCIIVSLDDIDTENAEQHEHISRIKCENGRLYISGSDDVSLLSAISSFIGEVIINCDRRENGGNLFYFPEYRSISYSWNYPLPIIPSCTLDNYMTSDAVELRFEFGGATDQVFSSYSDILRKIGFSLIDVQSLNECELSVFYKDYTKVYIKYYSNDSKITLAVTMA